MTEKMEIDIIVNNKKATMALDEVDNKVNKIEGSTKKLSRSTETITSYMRGAWMALGASVTAFVGTLVLATTKALALTKATFGLTDSMQKYIEATSNATGISQQLIAGFVQTGKSAEMSSKEIKKMVDMAIALGRAYPNESTEEFANNLIMLSTTGEAQGYIVDILESKWGKIDLKGKKLAEKMKVLEGATKGVNDKFEATAGSKLDVVFNKIENAMIGVGNRAIAMIDKWGWLDTVSDGLDVILIKFKKIENYNIKQTTMALKEQLTLIKELKEEESKAPLKTWNPFAKTKGQLSASRRLAQQKAILLQEQLKTLNTEVKATETADKAIVSSRKKRHKQEKALEDSKKARKEAIKKAEIQAERDHAKELRMLATEKRKAEREEAKAKAEQIREEARIRKQAEDAKRQQYEETQAVYNTINNQMADALTNWVMTGKLKYKDFARSVIAYLVKIRIMKALVNATSSFGMHTGGTVTKHTGGVVSHHDGINIKSDERMAKLQVGEAVVKRSSVPQNKKAIEAMNRGETVGGSVGNTTTATINFNVQAIDSSSFNQYLIRNRGTIEDVINKSLMTNGTVRKSVSQVMK